mgnify:CR=1 FL=1|tara:strand:- start:210 stop:470 length:261 start_codon:yes stop_codon:yes gene_type:complete
MPNAVVWSKQTCGFCTLAIKELERRNYNITVKKIIEPITPFEERESMYTKEDLLKVVPNARSVPQIFLEDKHIGGYTELMKYLSSA